MLEEILNRIKSGERISLQQLALELNVSEGMVRSALEQLRYMGYLQNVSLEDQCHSQCDNCAGCNIMSPNKLLSSTWELK